MIVLKVYNPIRYYTTLSEHSYLKRIARYVYAIRASESLAETVFSGAGNVLNYKSVNLSDQGKVKVK